LTAPGYGVSSSIKDQVVATSPARSARPWRRWLLLGAIASYLLVLHAAMLGAVMKSDFVTRVERKLGILKAGEFEGSYKRFAAAFARSDARARPGAIVFLGDSIMRDLDTSSIARHTLNLAIPTDTTAGVLKRSQAYRSLATARGVVIGVGVNDLVWRPIPEALRNYRSILELVPQATPVLALAVLPVDEREVRQRNADVGKLNAGIASLCAARPGCHFVDASRQLAGAGGNLLPSAHDGDGIHLSQVGHDIYWNVVNAAVVNFLPPANLSPPAQ
jgi:lysophospholipase L1-like esterase